MLLLRTDVYANTIGDICNQTFFGGTSIATSTETSICLLPTFRKVSQMPMGNEVAAKEEAGWFQVQNTSSGRCPSEGGGERTDGSANPTAERACTCIFNSTWNTPGNVTRAKCTLKECAKASTILAARSTLITSRKKVSHHRSCRDRNCSVNTCKKNSCIMPFRNVSLQMRLCFCLAFWSLMVRPCLSILLAQQLPTITYTVSLFHSLFLFP